ncbi:MAG: hypothetical protein ETSY1_01595 [Candidatus Entotheonella factor]|uniref:Dynamin N-terminal domain-containing protein n=1 Tax=Entotheonella factor TaxID=1429438 RepID=W4LYM3_ENTF1|nr:dynamin family protein [Candidatus Entotheonella palauensis]ETX03003.1 MAG: hypothetical protein ETSY1_01595 [Candidatus Entotheonella factor]
MLRYELVRNQTIALLSRLQAIGDTLELPQLSAALMSAWQQLEQNRYDVIVMGQAKRGKTTLINALIGRALLPADAEVNMRQGVRVSHAAQEAYRLRFEDESRQDITAADVLCYGTREVELTEEPLRPEHLIRSLEIEVSMPFLFEGLSLWDMPNMEAIGGTPTHLTQRFVRHADAIIYVLDSGHPMGQSDLDFIEAILEVTSHIFFIQTKIDQYEREQWEAVRQHNQDLLWSHFSNRLSQRPIRPISGVALLQAVQSGDNQETMQSHHDLCTALQTFLFEEVGQRRLAEALMVAEHDHDLSRQTLAGRLSALTEVSQEELAMLQRQAAERQQQFETEWGPSGLKRQELLMNLQQVMTLARQNFDLALQPGGETERTFQGQIQALTSINQARQFSTTLHEEVVTAATNRWLQVCEFTQNECGTLMAPFFAEAVHLPQAASQPDIQIDTEFTIKKEWLNKLSSGGREMKTLSALAGLPLTVLVGASILTGPIGMLTLTATGLFGFARGWTSSGKTQLKETRDQISKHMSSVLQEVRRYFFATELTVGSLSVVDQYFESLRQFASEQIDALVTQKSSEAQVEAARLLEQAPLDEIQRQVQAEQIQQHLADWDTLGAAIQQTMTELETVENIVPDAR